MKTSYLLSAFLVAIVGIFLSFSPPAFGDDGSRDMLSQALDLVDQAWSSQGEQISNEQRIDLLKKALPLIQNAPGRNFHGHRANAIEAVNAALGVLKRGDPYHTATEVIRKASDQLRAAMSIAT